MARLTAKKLARQVDEYLAAPDGVKTPAGLAAFLGVGTAALEETACGGGARGTVLQRAMARMEAELIESALRGDSNASMTSFLLKCCFGYQEKRTTRAEPQPARLPELSGPLAEMAE